VRRFTTFNPAMEDSKRKTLIDGWDRAVRAALSWANDSN
jgi:hypothetical protein